jgi:guanylate kinase
MSLNKKNTTQGRLFVLSAPSGTGKTTLVRKITKNYTHVVQSISFTTRKPRVGEIEGVDYFFISEKEFQKGIKEKLFLEYVEIFEKSYATSKSWVEAQLLEGKNVILVIDTEGALNLKKENKDIILVFLMPPSLEELERRLNKRNTEKNEDIKKRLITAQEEIKKAHVYDYVVINDDLTIAYNELKSILTQQGDSL